MIVHGAGGFDGNTVTDTGEVDVIIVVTVTDGKKATHSSFSLHTGSHEPLREALQAPAPSSRPESLANIRKPTESEAVLFTTKTLKDGVSFHPPPAGFDNPGITTVIAPHRRDRRWDLDSAVRNFPDQVVSDVNTVAGQVTSAAGPVASDAESAEAIVTSALASFESAAVSEGETFYSTVAASLPTHTSAVSGARAGSAPLLAGPLLLVLLFLFHVVFRTWAMP